jgi:hypothetical protein
MSRGGEQTYGRYPGSGAYCSERHQGPRSAHTPAAPIRQPIGPLAPAQPRPSLTGAASPGRTPPDDARAPILAIALYLTGPPLRAEPVVADAASAGNIADFLAALCSASTAALLVVSAAPHLEHALHQANLPPVVQVAPDANNATWRSALARLFALQHFPRAACPPRRGGSGIDTVTAIFHLRAALWLDLDSCTLLRQHATIPLTAREMRVLRIWLRAPHRYHRARDFAMMHWERFPSPWTSIASSRLSAHCGASWAKRPGARASCRTAVG